MGFDIECIIDLQSYPGEYFCPVCRTLVYPNEALQAQCTHVYCKPCLAHIANGTRACPYDGYLVTESDSKQLMESDKPLAEKIGKVKVHCLFFRSGCTWEGILSDSASHGSVCSFGNSPVICNRCGVQIVHRQVHEHAQVCPGVYDGQLPAAGVSGLTRSGTTSSTVPAAVNQTVAQTGAPVSQAQNPQNAAAAPLPVQNPNAQNSHSHNPPAAPVALAAPEQWYQQHYPQYYQQYVGYDPYQQHQQYYSLQQQPFQQYQQHQVQVQGQQQSHVYSQAVVQPQAQAQQHPQPQPLQQPHHVHQAPPQPPQMQAQGQAQTQSHSQPQMLPQNQPPQGQAQSLAPNYQVNPQQPLHPAMRPQTQISQQALPPPPPSQSTQPSQHPQATGVQPPAQHQQVPQYQQPQGPVHHSQASQAHMQPQMHPQTQAYTQSSNQLNVQTQPQSQTYQSQSQPPNNLPQAQHPPATPVSGHQSYPQAQHPQANQLGALQQHLVHPHQASVPHHPVQVHGQVPQQPALMRPSQSHGSVSQQPSTLLPPQSMVPGAPLATSHQFLPYGQQPTYPAQPLPPMQPVQQQPSNYAQQQQSHAAFQGHMHQQGHLPPLQTMQSQMQMNYGPPQPQQSQNYVGTTPMMPNQGTLSQSHPLSSGGFGPLALSGPAQGASTQTSVNQNHAKPTILEQNATAQDIRSPSKRPSEKNFEGESLIENVRAGHNETALKDANNAANDGLVKSVINQEKGDIMGTLEQSFGGKSSEAGFGEDEFHKEETHSLTESVPLKQGNLDNHMNLSKTAVAGQSSANYDRQSLSAVPPSSTEGHMLPPKSHGSHSDRSPAQVDGKPASAVGPQGPVAVPHHGQSHKLTDGKSQYGPYSARVDSKIAIAPQYVEGYYGPQHVARPNEITMPRDRMLGSGEGGPLVKPHADEPSFLRTNGGPAPDSSMFGPRDENMKPLSKEQLNFFPREPTRPLEQGSRSLDKPFHGPMYDAGSKMDPGDLGSRSGFLPHRPSGGHNHQDVLRSGPEFGQHHIKSFAYQNPGGDYLSSSPRRFGGPSSFTHGSSSLDDYNSREPHRFGEGPMSSNLPSDPVGNSFRDGRFPPLPGGHPRRGEIDGPMNPRFGEHMPPAQIHNQTGSDDTFWADGPGHLTRGKPSGPGYLPGHFNMGETAGPGTFSGHGYAGEVAGNFPRPPFSEHVGGDRPGFPPFGDPAMRNNYPHGFPNARNFSGGMDSIDQSRHRKPPSTGWCRICELDCEAVEGLEIHSQTREHQNMAMDMVKRFKFKGRKKHRPAGRMSHEGGRSRKMGSGGRGKRH
ncbi:hypothetical protein ACS0TY_014809 [Phlomoides rotata]